VSRLLTADALLARVVARPRFNATLLALFAAVALVLAAVGLYGVISYSVAQRTREFGVRMALGATGRAVVGRVVAEGMRRTGLGVAIGLAGALLLSRLMTRLLFGVSATDPLTFAALSTLLGGVALLASWIPARRAARVDPVVALRAE
jgi:ABC-type antimicrobial peptide transport system permease subunit